MLDLPVNKAAVGISLRTSLWLFSTKLSRSAVVDANISTEILYKFITN